MSGPRKASEASSRGRVRSRRRRRVPLTAGRRRQVAEPPLAPLAAARRQARRRSIRVGYSVAGSIRVGCSAARVSLPGLAGSERRRGAARLGSRGQHRRRPGENRQGLITPEKRLNSNSPFIVLRGRAADAMQYRVGEAAGFGSVDSQGRTGCWDLIFGSAYTSLAMHTCAYALRPLHCLSIFSRYIAFVSQMTNRLASWAAVSHYLVKLSLPGHSRLVKCAE